VIFKRAALAALKDKFFKKMDERLPASGVRAEMARLTIARQLAAVTLAIWKSGEDYDARKLSKLTASAEGASREAELEAKATGKRRGSC